MVEDKVMNKECDYKRINTYNITKKKTLKILKFKSRFF